MLYLLRNKVYLLCGISHYSSGSSKLCGYESGRGSTQRDKVEGERVAVVGWSGGGGWMYYDAFVSDLTRSGALLFHQTTFSSSLVVERPKESHEYNRLKGSQMVKKKKNCNCWCGQCKGTHTTRASCGRVEP